jgi:DNA polymerase III epsilon subunit-like protein
MKIFFDTEFTGLQKETKLISIGLVSENDLTFYAEIEGDFSKVDKWIEENVINKLNYNNYRYYRLKTKSNAGYSINVKCSLNCLKHFLTEWLEQFDSVEMWSDCLAYDWVLFCDIFGHAFNIPKNIYYIPFDISTLFKMKGIDPNISRFDFVNMSSNLNHNALEDAKVIKMCYDKMIEEI